jgi:uncharacterized protein with PIN domain
MSVKVDFKLQNAATAVGKTQLLLVHAQHSCRCPLCNAELTKLTSKHAAPALPLIFVPL